MQFRRIRLNVQVIEVSLHDVERDLTTMDTEPSTVLERSVELIAEQLDCTEEEAQRFLFGK